MVIYFEYGGGTLRVLWREKQNLGYGHVRSRRLFSSVVVCVSECMKPLLQRSIYKL
jgi:hypothetical protein